MNPTPKDADDHSFLFQVDILVNAKTNGSALENLLRVLNNGGFADFRIGTGIMLGQVIEEALKRENGPAKPLPAGPATPKTPAPQADELEVRIRQYIDANKLIRLNVNKGRGIKLSIPCRILRFDATAQLLTVYHVDEKQVHTFKLFEIDDFLE